MYFQGVMVQLVPRVTVRQTNLGIQLRTLTGRHFLFGCIRLVISSIWLNTRLHSERALCEYCELSVNYWKHPAFVVFYRISHKTKLHFSSSMTFFNVLSLKRICNFTLLSIVSHINDRLKIK